MEFLSDQGWIQILIFVFYHFDLDAKHPRIKKRGGDNNLEENIVTKDDDSLGFICILAIIKMRAV